MRAVKSLTRRHHFAVGKLLDNFRAQIRKRGPQHLKEPQHILASAAKPWKGSVIHEIWREQLLRDLLISQSLEFVDESLHNA